MPMPDFQQFISQMRRQQPAMPRVNLGGFIDPNDPLNPFSQANWQQIQRAQQRQPAPAPMINLGGMINPNDPANPFASANWQQIQKNLPAQTVSLSPQMMGPTDAELRQKNLPAQTVSLSPQMMGPTDAELRQPFRWNITSDQIAEREKRWGASGPVPVPKLSVPPPAQGGSFEPDYLLKQIQNVIPLYREALDKQVPEPYPFPQAIMVRGGSAPVLETSLDIQMSPEHKAWERQQQLRRNEGSASLAALGHIKDFIHPETEIEKGRLMFGRDANRNKFIQDEMQRQMATGLVSEDEAARISEYKATRMADAIHNVQSARGRVPPPGSSNEAPDAPPVSSELLKTIMTKMGEYRPETLTNTLMQHQQDLASDAAMSSLARAAMKDPAFTKTFVDPNQLQRAMETQMLDYLTNMREPTEGRGRIGDLGFFNSPRYAPNDVDRIGYPRGEERIGGFRAGFNYAPFWDTTRVLDAPYGTIDVGYEGLFNLGRAQSVKSQFSSEARADAKRRAEVLARFLKAYQAERAKQP